MIHNQHIAKTAQPVGVHHAAIGHGAHRLTATCADKHAFPGHALGARSAKAAGDFAAHRQPELALQAGKSAARAGIIGNVIHRFGWRFGFRFRLGRWRRRRRGFGRRRRLAGLGGSLRGGQIAGVAGLGLALGGFALRLGFTFRLGLGFAHGLFMLGLRQLARLFGLARGFAALGFQFAVDLVDQGIDALFVSLQLAQLLALLLNLIGQLANHLLAVFFFLD